MVTIRQTGMVKLITAAQALGAGGRAIKGPVATWGSRLIYAPIIETGIRQGRMWRRAGPARMFEQGIAETMPIVKPTLLAAIPLGTASVGQAKRKIRDEGLARIKALTPVKTGALRESVSEMTRPGIA